MDLYTATLEDQVTVYFCFGIAQIPVRLHCYVANMLKYINTIKYSDVY